MTGQTPHLVALREREYAMLERSGDGLFDPRAHGATLLLQISRACPHGYVCSYSVDADRLLLTALSLSLDPPDQSLPIVGPPDVVNPRARFTHAWHRLRVEVPFSGAMLLGRDYLHGHRPNLTAPRYGEVRELVFEVGRVVVDDDMSDHFARYRALEEAVRRGQPDAAARVRAYILGDDELRGRYPFKAHLQRLWEWAQARTRHLGDDAHQARPKVEGPALEAASKDMVQGPAADGDRLEGVCPRCGGPGTLRVCRTRRPNAPRWWPRRLVVVCYPCYWDRINALL